jgi:UDP:flavonoid glycosyltransferase YjiC (YdhE family)
MCNITIFAFGSRDDVQPYVALGRRFQQVGYRITVLAGDEFKEFVTRSVLTFDPLGFCLRQGISESEACAGYRVHPF